MMQTKPLCSAVFCLTLFSSFPCSAQPILSDTFSRSVGNAEVSKGAMDSDWGGNDNGLGGRITQSWVTSPDRLTMAGKGVQQTVDGSRGILRYGAVLHPYDLFQDPEVKASKTFTLDFDFTRQHKVGFISVFFGARPEKVSGKDEKAAFAPLDQRGDYANEVDAAFTFTFDNQGGRVQAWSYGLQVGPAVDKAYVDTAGSVGTNHARVVAFAPEGFLPGRKATFELYVDGRAVSTLATTLDGGPGTFGFSCNQGTVSGGGFIDNLIVTSVPEPGM